MFGGQSEQGSEAGTEEEFVSAALGSDESVNRLSDRCLYMVVGSEAQLKTRGS